MAYAAAKAGIEVLSRELAAQAGPAGVRVNCIAPETILTERNQQQIPEAIQEQLQHAHPIPRLGTPDDVAHAALFLASDHSSWISGITHWTLRLAAGLPPAIANWRLIIDPSPDRRETDLFDRSTFESHRNVHSDSSGIPSRVIRSG